MHADVAHGFVPVERRQAGEIAFHERLHRREIEAADEREGEAARVGVAVFEERERFVEIHLIDAFDRHRLRAGMVLAERAVERVLEDFVRLRVPVRERHFQLIGQHPERDRIGPRRREGEIDQLKHRVEIFVRRAARQPVVAALRGDS